MHTVQGLRKRAEVAGNLTSTSEQSVVHEKESIIIVAVAEGSRARARLPCRLGAYGAYAARVLPLLRPLLRRQLSQRFVQRVVLDLAQPLGVGARRLENRRLTMATGDNRFLSQAGRAQVAASGAWQHDAAHRRGVDYPHPAMQAPPGGAHVKAALGVSAACVASRT